MNEQITGALFKQMVLHGAAAITAQKQAINDLNVFPVPDGDTGTNMAMTIGTAVTELKKSAPATVDKAVKYSFGLRLPQLAPMENADMVGTDLTYNIHDYILKDLEDSHEPSPLLKKLRDEGKIGFKTGEGFQKWTPEQVAKANADLNEYLIRMLYGK